MFKILRTKLVVFGATLLASSSASFLVPAHTLAISGQAVTAFTNNQRSANGLAPLAWNAALGNSAWLKAQDMCAKGYWSHTAPDGVTGWTFMSRSGYAYTTASENLARGFSDDAATVASWMASPGHRANILNAAYTDTGVGSATCNFEGATTTFVVAHYGATSAPTSAPAPKAVAAPTPQARPRSVAPPTKQAAVLSDQPEPVPSRVTAASPPEVKLAKVEPSFGTKLWDMTWPKKQSVGVFSAKLA